MQHKMMQLEKIAPAQQADLSMEAGCNIANIPLGQTIDSVYCQWKPVLVKEITFQIKRLDQLFERQQAAIVDELEENEFNKDVKAKITKQLQSFSKCHLQTITTLRQASDTIEDAPERLDTSK